MPRRGKDFKKLSFSVMGPAAICGFTRAIPVTVFGPPDLDKPVITSLVERMHNLLCPYSFCYIFGIEKLTHFIITTDFFTAPNHN